LHRAPGRPLIHALHNGAEAHEEEEPPGGAELRPTTHPPQAEMVYERRHGERTHDRARPPQECAAGSGPEDDEKVPEELVPAVAPKVPDGCGQPRAVRDGRPLRGRLAEECSSDQRREVVHGIDHRVRPHATTNGGERCRGEAGQKGQGWVEEAATAGVVDRGADALHDVLRGVERREFYEQFGTDPADGGRGGVLAGEWVAGPRPSDAALVAEQRSKASRRMFERDNGRSTGASVFWSFGNSYLLSGLAMKAHSNDLSATNIIDIYKL
jgi:hypothetical protein